MWQNTRQDLSKKPNTIHHSQAKRAIFWEFGDGRLVAVLGLISYITSAEDPTERARVPRKPGQRYCICLLQRR